MKTLFTEHPHSLGETYFSHMKCAFTIGGKMMLGGMIYLLHGVFPFLLKKTGSSLLLNATRTHVERIPQPHLDERVVVIADIVAKQTVKPKRTRAPKATKTAA